MNRVKFLPAAYKEAAMGDILILSVLALCCILAVRSLYKGRKQGGCSGCSSCCGSCTGCPGNTK